jgi:NitT/TauT family transport system substrate-binding protein
LTTDENVRRLYRRRFIMDKPRPSAKLSFIALAVFLTILQFVQPSEAQVKKVRVAIPGYTIAVLSFLAAKANGYYASEGLDVELVAMRGPTANVAVLSGSVEFSAVPLAGLTTALRGAPLKVLFSQNDRPQHVLFAKADLQNLKALRGKKIAVVGPGAIDDVLLREVFSANGMDGGKDATILAIGTAETRFAALASGTVDAAVLIAPFTFNAKEAGFKELITFKDEGFVLPSGGIVARDELLKADPSTVEKFVRATLMGFIVMRDSRPAAIKVLSRNLRIEEPTAARIYDSARPTMTADGALSDEAQKKVVSFVMKQAAVKEAPPYDKLFDFSVIKKANVTLQAKGWQPGKRRVFHRRGVEGALYPRSAILDFCFGWRLARSASPRTMFIRRRAYSPLALPASRPMCCLPDP